MTKEEREAKREAKKQERAAKRAAILEQKKAATEAKKLAREEKKAKRLALLEQEKAKKAAIRQKKREAREAKRAKEIAKKRALKEKKLALKNAKKQKKTIIKTADSVDIKDAAKAMKKALKQLATEFAEYDCKKIGKKSKAIAWLGYEVNVEDGNVTIRFNVAKSKKMAESVQPKENDAVVPDILAPNDASIDDEDLSKNDEEKEEVEMVPAGDLYGSNGEVANIDIDEDDESSFDEDDETSDDSIFDHRDETDEDLIEARREYFGTFGDDGNDYD